MTHPLKAVTEADPTLDIQITLPGESGGGIALQRIGNEYFAAAAEDCETVLLQRPTDIDTVHFIPALRKKGIKVVMDVDDDLEQLSPRHPTWQMLRELPGHSADTPIACAPLVDSIVTSSQALYDKYKQHNPNTHLCRNKIPRSAIMDQKFESPGDEHSVTIGWPGSIGTHPDDLAAMGSSIAQLRQRFLIVGDPHPAGERQLGVPVEFTGPIEFVDWIRAINHYLDVGVAPLEPIPFNVSKSWLKPLELSAAFVPFVGSDTPEYRALGAGLIVEKPKDWLRLIRLLVGSEDFRLEEANRNREIALANTYETEETIAEWRKAWMID